MKAIILGAGYGSRLGELTKDIPKNLLDVNGKTILERQIEKFKNCGIEEIVVIVGPNKQKYQIRDVKYVVDTHFDDHEQLSSLMVAKDDIKNEVIISFADILIDDEIMKQIVESSQEIGIAIDLDWKLNYEGRTQHPVSEADLVWIQNNNIREIKKNLLKRDGGETGEFLGMIKLDYKGSEEFVKRYELLEDSHEGEFQNSKSFQKGYLTDMLQDLIYAGIQVKPIFVHGKWCEIDTLQDLEIARKKFK